MKHLYLLDCTLRDGGYVNDWGFGNMTIRSVITRLNNAGIDIIECGFLDSRVKYDKDRTLYPDIPSIYKTLGNTLSPKKAKITAMIDFGTFDENLLIPQCSGVLDGIRLIFKKEQVDDALLYAQKIKDLGYMLFLNPVALPSYRNIELIQLISKINDVNPFAISIVDTYGMMFNNDINKFIAMIDDELDDNIAIGYHCHNNLQMANSHCINFASKLLKRERIIDSTILGMGKNAGNACTELLASYLVKCELKAFEINHILDCAYTDIMKFNTKSAWGYSLDNLISALQDCSPNWVKFLISKNTLSINGILTILESLPYEKREVSYFTKELAEQKYLEYMNHFANDSEAKKELSEVFNRESILLLCPGNTLKTHRAAVEQYISDNSPIVVTVNFVTDEIRADYAFISNSIRYSQMVGVCTELSNKPQIILTSNIVAVNVLEPDFTINFKTLYEKTQGESSTALLISLLKDLGVTSIAIAGMDGFDEYDMENSFFDKSMMLASFNNINKTLIKQLQRVIDDVDIAWITPSKLKEVLAT